LTVGQLGRRDSATEDLYLIVHDHLLDEPPRVVSDTAIVPEDDFHFLARDGVAVVLHVEARAGRGLPARGGKTGTGHGKAHADLDHLLRRHSTRAQRDRGGCRDCNGEWSAWHNCPPRGDARPSSWRSALQLLSSIR